MLIVLTMGQDCEKFLEMNLDSIKEADKIIFCQGYENKPDENKEMNKILGNFHTTQGYHIECISNKWNKNDVTMNGKQRNFYLNYLKKNYPYDWVLILDCDEILDDNGIQKIKDFINDPDRKDGLYNVKMRHFIGDLGHEDATTTVHVVPRRLFKISEAKSYPLHSHPVLNVDGKDLGETMGACLDTTIWHLGHLPISYLDYILKRYKQHVNDSIYHPKDYLHNWKLNHLFGVYPQKQINPVELPKQICDRYEIDKDYFYFNDRNLELKHYRDAEDWIDFFFKDKKQQEYKSAILFGCGKGPRVRALNSMGVNVWGFDKSKYAVENSLSSSVFEGDILNVKSYDKRQADLVVAYDLLEHIEYDKLQIALSNLVKASTKYILVSVPVLGDPNLEADPTHIIKEDKNWWIQKFLDKGLKLIPTPEHFQYKQQIMIFEK